MPGSSPGPPSVVDDLASAVGQLTEAGSLPTNCVDVIANGKSSRSASCTGAEDIYICHAWVATSEDEICGTDQKSPEFKAKLHLNYLDFVKRHNDKCNTKCSMRSRKSVWDRFKRLSKCTLKCIGILETCGDPLSGDKDKEVCDRKVKELFVKRCAADKNMCETLVNCHSYLQNKPKWRFMQESQELEDKEREEKRKRPQGTKKEKEKEADRQLVKRALEGGGQLESKKTHLEKKEAFMTETSKTFKEFANMFTSAFDESSQMQLMNTLSPLSKKQMEKQTFATKIAKLKAEESHHKQAADQIEGENVISLLGAQQDDQDDEEEDILTPDNEVHTAEQAAEQLEQSQDDSEVGVFDYSLSQID